MIKELFLCLSLAFSQVFPEDYKLKRFNSCYRIVKLKLALEKQEIDEFIETFDNPEQASNRISTDLLMTCYSSISTTTADDILAQGNELYMKDKYHDLTILDLASYENEEMNLNHQHLRFFEEIKKIKDQSENNDPIDDLPPLPEVGNWYILLVVSGFSITLYYLISKVRPNIQKYESKRKKQ